MGDNQMEKYFTRVYDVYTGEITDLSFQDNEADNEKVFKALCEKKFHEGQHYYMRFWCKDGITWCDYGSHCWFVQKGKANCK